MCLCDCVSVRARVCACACACMRVCVGGGCKVEELEAARHMVGISMCVRMHVCAYVYVCVREKKIEQMHHF